MTRSWAEQDLRSRRSRRFPRCPPGRQTSVVQIWSIRADSWANHQAPGRTHKSLILLGFRCPVVPGRRPEGLLERTFYLVLRDPGASDSSAGGPETLAQGTADERCGSVTQETRSFRFLSAGSHSGRSPGPAVAVDLVLCAMFIH